ncbi:MULTISPECIES: hypothetical protein [unclassified Aureimonas]|uniref:hypothetical protein n=1 Tax=unclassified Aureimonas TaxID=2615206 RepID=UPI0006FF9ABD|nr:MULTISPECIES: hypothetical protein [unclassified Aureimonas]KQT57486.1 hypothetical protein ASG62_09205 [Aureimonas sp. Leaf427]KQT77166.1 hypothetical protein ASG54_13075 [Aureimonas sp. Leaf460]
MSDENETARRVKAAWAGTTIKKRGRTTFIPTKTRKRASCAPRFSNGVKFRYEFHFVTSYLDPPYNTHPFTSWIVTQIANDRRSRFAEGTSDEALAELVADLREQGHRVEEFKTGCAGGSR